MTDDEFQRIKEAEKERLRAQKRLRATLESLKRRNEVQSVVRRMSQGAKRLLRKTEAFADKVATQAARQAARLEVAVEDSADDGSLEDAEGVLREKRAEAHVRRMKTQETPAASHPSQATTADSDESASSDTSDERSNDGPDKTIGRMGNRRADD